MDRSKVAVVIPNYNERRSICGVIASAKEYGCVIVVDDGSTDDSVQAARSAGAEVLQHKINKGYDGALNTGIMHAYRKKFQVILTMDADGQHSSDDIPRFLSAMTEHDMAIGCRQQKQRVSEKLFAVYTRLRWGIRDPLCGMKAYSGKVVGALGHFDCYQSIGTEMMLHGLRHGYSTKQIPIVVSDRPEGDVPRMGTLLSANFKILRAFALSFFK